VPNLTLAGKILHSNTE